ncbi:hypothetical protein BASA81_007763 [Batrachochytrium salamandrivorans]|nr:hypothetical protein BASA81_007763 [Batrachochytrium salamandrivorans]
MSTGNLSKDFFELIKAIGESKSKQEEDRIVQDEVRNLKLLLADLKSSNSSKRMRELLVRLIYVEMLGHDASWGYVVAVQQTATTNLYVFLPPPRLLPD